MKRVASACLLAWVAIAAACGSPEAPGREDDDGVGAPVTQGSLQAVEAEVTTSEAPAPDGPAPGELRCTSDATPSMLLDAQFAFVGVVTQVDEQLHPWTTDPENHERPEVAEPTPWVTFEVEQWYTSDWGTTFSVWVPTFTVEVGDRLAVGGNAYFTEVLDFAGQSGEIELCASLSPSESGPTAWEEYFGAGTPPSAPSPDSGSEPPPGPGTKVFGDHVGTCGVTVLDNKGDDDQALLSEGATCFLKEFEAGRPLVWDVVIATVEGDPIPARYDYDGQAVTITTDYSFDRFGSGGISARRCTGVQPSSWLPEGTACTDVDGDGFLRESLPYGA